MPRIYAPNQAHTIDWAQVPFVLGVAAVAAGEDTTFFSDAGYTIDASKHAREVWDGLTVAQIDELIAYFGGTPSAEDSKYTKVRALETLFSAKFIAALTVASAAATTDAGSTKITITSPGTATYYLKTAETTSPDILYGDVPGTGWQELTLVTGVADDVVPNGASDDKFTVVRVTAGGTVDAIAKGNLTLKAE